MNVLHGIERVSNALEALRKEVDDLKLLVSETEPQGSYARAGIAKFEDQMKIVVAYLALAPGIENDELLTILLNCAQQVVGAEGAALTLYEDRKDVLIFRAATGVAADKIIGWEVPLINSQHGIAFRMRQVIASTPMNRAIDEATGISYRNVLIAPLIIDDEAIGTVSAVNKITEDHFTPQDIETYSGFADLAAHIIRQRIREHNLKQIIEGDATMIPKELAGVKCLTGDSDFLEIMKNIVMIVNRSPELLPLCKQLIGTLAGV